MIALFNAEPAAFSPDFVCILDHKLRARPLIVVEERAVEARFEDSPRHPLAHRRDVRTDERRCAIRVVHVAGTMQPREKQAELRGHAK